MANMKRVGKMGKLLPDSYSTTSQLQMLGACVI